jgi:hypothetical protein
VPTAVLVLALLSFAPQASHPKTFWTAIAQQKYALPAGESAPALASELVAALGSPDPVMRDDLAYSILTSWIYTQKLLGPDDVRTIAKTLQANLDRGIGGPEGDGVLLRSFSALVLSVIAARDNADPFLTQDEYQALLENALTYFARERDLRGFDAAKGWMHSAAHTADLLKFLARNSKLRPLDQRRILSALITKNRDAAVPFAQGEDERMARVVISIVRRSDFDRTAFSTWLSEAQTLAAFPKQPAVPALRAQQNARHLLSSLWSSLTADERPSDGAEFARVALRDALKTLYQ